MLCFDFKEIRLLKGEKDIVPLDFAEYPRKSNVSENSEVY